MKFNIDTIANIFDHKSKDFSYWLARHLVKNRGTVFIALIFIILSFLPMAGNIKVDNALELWFLKDDPTLVAYNEFKEIYGNDEIILATINTGKDYLYSEEFFKKIQKISNDLVNDKENIARVTSFATIPYITSKNNEVLIENLMPLDTTKTFNIDDIKQKINSSPELKKLLLNKEETIVGIIIEPVATHEMDLKRPDIIKSVRDKLKDTKYRLAGMGVMYDELNQLSMTEGGIYSALSYTVIAFLVFFLYRQWGFFWSIVITMGLSGSAFMAIYGLANQNFNMVTIVLPTLMIILSISDVTYIINIYCHKISSVIRNKEEGLIEVFGESLAPCLFTSICNGLGFLSLMDSPMAVLKNFGFYAGISCFVEYFIATITTVYILGRITPTSKDHFKRPFEKWIRGWVNIIPTYHKQIITILIIASVCGIYGMTKLNIDTYSMGFLYKKNQVRTDSDMTEKHFGNYLPLEARIITKKENGILDIDFLQRLNNIEQEIQIKNPKFERPISILTPIKALYRATSSADQNNKKINTSLPTTTEEITRLLELYKGARSFDLKSLTDWNKQTNTPNFQEARITFHVPMISITKLRELEEYAREFIEAEFQGMDVELKFGGYVPLYSRLVSYVTESQISEFLWALVFIFFAMAVLLRKVEAIFLGIIPNLFPIIMTMGLMGYLGVSLDIATVTIASIVLGIVVDDTIHELYVFFYQRAPGSDPVKDIQHTLIETGPAVVATSIIYALGFMVLIFASIKSVNHYGILLAITIFFAMVCEITILPALICTFKKYFPGARKNKN